MFGKRTQDTAYDLEKDSSSEYKKTQDNVQLAVDKATNPLHNKIKRFSNSLTTL